MIFFGCKSSKNEDSVKSIVSNVEDTVLFQKKVSGNLLSDSCQKKYVFKDKLRDKVSLDSSAYEELVSFLNTNNDESQSEEVGYLLYQFFKGNEEYNQSFERFLSKKQNSMRDSILSALIQIMCLDLGEDNYTYQRLIKDFPVFKNSEVVKSEFENCVDSENL
jgi:hypothetical protein